MKPASYQSKLSSSEPSERYPNQTNHLVQFYPSFLKNYNYNLYVTGVQYKQYIQLIYIKHELKF